MKSQQYRFGFSSLILAFALILSFSTMAQSSTAVDGPFQDLAHSLEMRFRVMNLEDFDPNQFHDSLEKKSPLFTRLTWIGSRKVLEIVYARQFEGNEQKGLVVEITLPNGPWKNPDFGGRDLGEMISTLLASLSVTIGRQIS